jgi:branched-chain amino acid transport system permease protein
VIVVVGGMGSIPGAYLAALIIAEPKALCAAHWHRCSCSARMLCVFQADAGGGIPDHGRGAGPCALHGLLGRPQAASRNPAEHSKRRCARRSLHCGWPAWLLYGLLLLLLPLAGQAFAPYLTCWAIDLLIAVLFATSLHFIMGPGGMHSFGHAAYFGLGAYGAALFLKGLHLPMEAVAAGWRRWRWLGRAAVWLVLRAPVRRLLCNADTGFSQIVVVHRLPVR